jgi:hypothetical protein
MYDSTNPSDIPADAAIVCGYVAPSHYVWPASGWARFPNAVKVRVTPAASVHGLGVHVLDVEHGDAVPAQVPGWVQASRQAGQEGTIYCPYADWPAVIRAINAAGIVTHPPYWIAKWDGVAALPSVTVDGTSYTATAKQYLDPTTGSGGHFDLSVVAAYWPGVDGNQPQEASDVNLSDTVIDPTTGKPLADINDTLFYIDLYTGQTATMLPQVLTQLAAINGALSTNQAQLLSAIAAHTDGTPTDDQVHAQAATIASILTATLPEATVVALGAALAAKPAS